MVRNLRNKKNTAALDEDTYDQSMTILLSILEPLLINDLNMETMFKLNSLKDLMDIMMEQPLPSESGVQRKARSYFKYAIRCITSCLRSETGVATVSLFV